MERFLRFTCVRRTVMLTTLFVVLIGLTGFAEDAPIKVAVVVHKPEGFRNMFWDSLQMGARKAGKELNVEITYAGVPTEYGDDRVSGQTAAIEKAISDGARGIVLTPAPPRRGATPLPATARRGVW